MLKLFVRFLLIFTLLSQVMTFASCEDNNADNQYVNTNNKQKKESLEKANRYMVLKEKEDVDNYIERHHLKVNWLGTGFCYSIVKQGDTELIKKGNLVTLDYEVRFLTGELVYNSKENGPKMFVVGMGGVENGLEEAIVNLHKNDVAVIILPSNMAYGILGDGNKIPPKTPIVYNLKVIENQSYN